MSDDDYKWNDDTQSWITPSEAPLQMTNISGRAYCTAGCGKPIVFGTHPERNKRVPTDPKTHTVHTCDPEDLKAKMLEDMQLQPIRKKVRDASLASVLRTHNDLYHKMVTDPQPLTDLEKMYYKACDERIKQHEGASWAAQL